MNPRRIKQFLNAFRLRVYIAVETGLLDEVSGKRELGLEHLGAFTAISLKYPELLLDAADRRTLLSEIERYEPDDLPNLPPLIRKWVEYEDLLLS